MTAASNAGLVRLLAGAPGAASIETPVVFVHGYGGNASNWLTVELALRRAGFQNLHAMLYNPLAETTPRIAARLARDCRTAMRESGSRRVHVLAHSYGGIVVRYAVARLGLGRAVQTAVTVATPHGGAAIARLGRGPVAADLRPGSDLLRMLASTPHPGCVRWVSYWSDRDPIVRPSSAILRLPGLQVVNVPITGEGHVSILRSPVLTADLVTRLVVSEARRGRALPAVGPTSDAALSTPLAAS
jgi:pimeloyl-ACP methyl ester carboxylesterase